MKKKKKKNGNKSKNKDGQQKKWAQLSDDLVVEIMSRLCLLSDQVRFRAVCKNWSYVVDEYSNNNNNNIVLLPWAIDIETTHDNIEFCIYEPISSDLTKPTLVYKTNLHKFDNIFPYIKKFPYMSYATQKFGWIFSSTRGSRPLSFLLFSPLTKKEIILPRLAYWHHHQLLVKTFSTKPDSPDCVFLVLYRCIYNNAIIVNVFCHGFNEWKSQEFDEVKGFCHPQLTTVYIEGIFYFVVPVGQLTSYNVALGECKVESGFIDNRFTDYVGIYKAFELNGDLMLIGIHKYAGFIKMFDRSTKVWVPLKSLGDHSIFISYNSVILVPTIEKEERSNYGVLPNKIYCCSWKHGVYSFESGKLVKFTDELQITKWAKATDLNCWYWFAPAEDLLKRKETRNSLVELPVPEETILPVVTDKEVVHSN